MKIAIAMPTVGGSVYVQALTSIVSACRLFAQSGIDFSFINVDFSEVVIARNSVARRFLADGSATHLLFVDYDMAFSPNAVKRIIEARKPLIGCAYPKRQMNLERIVAILSDSARDEPPDVKTAVSIASDYVIRQAPSDGKVRFAVKKGLVQVAGVGMGLTLIERRVFDGLMASGQLSVRHRDVTLDEESGPSYGFFDNIANEDGSILSEDFSFCEKWRRYCGGEVWCNVADEIGHYGSYGFKGTFLEKLAFMGTREAEAE